MIRRLPVYILADCSGSMSGAPIEAVKQGIRLLHSNLMGDPSAIESAFLSVITFDSAAQQIVPLTEVSAFTPPNLTASGSTALGEALKLLIECIDLEVRKTSSEQKGDWKPLVFLLTDGNPTDSWEPYAQQIKSHKPSPTNVIAVACGEDVDTNMLKQITDTVLLMNDVSAESFNQFFKWVSASVAQTSAKCGSSPDAAAAGVALPPPPPGITIVP